VSLLACVGSRAAHGVIPEVAPETEAPERLVKVERVWAIAEHAAREGGAAVHVRADDHLADIPVASDGMLCEYSIVTSIVSSKYFVWTLVQAKLH